MPSETAVATESRLANETPLGLVRRQWSRLRSRGPVDSSLALIGKVLRDPVGLAGVLVVSLLLVVSLFPGMFTGYDPLSVDIGSRLQPPGADHPFGTDDLGRDMLSRIVFGTRVSLFSAVGVVGVAGLIGIFLGAIAGFTSNFVDDVIMRIADIFIAFPSMIMAMAIVAVLGPSLQHAMIALIVIWWPQYARLARGQVVSVRNTLFVEAAYCIGASSTRVLGRHILPSCISPLMVKLSLDVGVAILATAGLSFLGLGVKPPTPELGALVTQGRQFLLISWWYSTIPGLFIFLAVLGFSLVGDSLRDALDPTLL